MCVHTRGWGEGWDTPWSREREEMGQPPTPQARKELTPVMFPPGCGVPFPTVGTRLQTERGEGGGGGGGEGSPGPALWLVSPISRWKREAER